MHAEEEKEEWEDAQGARDGAANTKKRRVGNPSGVFCAR